MKSNVIVYLRLVFTLLVLHLTINCTAQLNVDCMYHNWYFEDIHVLFRNDKLDNNNRYYGKILCSKDSCDFQISMEACNGKSKFYCYYPNGQLKEEIEYLAEYKYPPFEEGLDSTTNEEYVVIYLIHEKRNGLAKFYTMGKKKHMQVIKD